MTKDSIRSRASLWRASPAAVSILVLLWPWRAAFGWGHKGHAVVGLIAEHYMTGAALAKAGDLLGGSTIDSVASWADDYRHDHPETGPWHYIDIPLADDKIDLTRECPNGDCVIAKTEQFLAVLQDPQADRAAKAEALKFVVHFVGDMHQPLHDEDDGDKGGNTRRVIFDGKPDNLHWIWDTGLLEQHSIAIPRRSPRSWRARSPVRTGRRGRRAALIGCWKAPAGPNRRVR